MLKLDHINKSYADKKVLDDFSISCGNTGITALMGSSGIGKTTLLNIISGLEKADSGNVENTFEKTSYKFQDARLFSWLSAKDNVKAVIADDENAEEKALQMLKLVGLGESENKFPAELSGGMQQRVALARALVYQGDLLLLDEPFSAVDAETKKQLISIVKEYAENHCVILVTHDLAEAELLGASILKIK